MKPPVSPALSRLLTEAAHVSASEHAELCARFVILSLYAKHGPRWLSSPAPERKESGPLPKGRWHLPVEVTERQRVRLEGCETLLDVVRGFQLKGVALDSRLGLVGWMEARYPLDLRFDIPAPHEMLAHQCRGRRFVTFRNSEELLFEPIGRHRGALEFLLHDLEHAHKFFGDPHLQQGQIAFFRKLTQALEARIFSGLLAEAKFEADFHYLMSDMNSHPLHLWKYLKAIVLSACERLGLPQGATLQIHEQILNLWQSPKEVRDAALRINYPELESDQDRWILSQYFLNSPEKRASYVVQS